MASWIGSYVPGVPRGGLDDLVGLETKLGGYKMHVVNWFQSISESLDPNILANLSSHGSVPMVTLEFMVSNPSNLCSRIAAGEFDTKITSMAKVVKLFGKSVLIRPLHEMNGNWYPWNGTINGNSPEEVIEAFRHIFRVFQSAGAVNARFVWCVNNDSVPNTSANQIEKYWPGASYVYYMAIDGYNFGGTANRSFRATFEPSYKRVAALSSTKPIMIAETACSSDVDKVTWIRRMFSDLPLYFPRIRGVVWFNALKERDWRIQSSSQTLAEFIKGLSTLR